MIRRLFSTRGGSFARSVLRTGIVCATAFGLDWSPEQIAAVQLAAEALLQFASFLVVGDEPTPEG